VTDQGIQPAPGKRLVARMNTEKGLMSFELYPDRAPKTVANFVQLSRTGFYDGLTFHRVIRGFMIQGGCPKGDGTGNPGYTIPAEFNDLPHEKGVISMARGADPDSAGCQFFVVHSPHAAHLDGAYTAFGKLVEGFDVLDAIASAPVTRNGSERSRPVEPVKILGIEVEEVEIEAEAPPEEDAPGEGGEEPPAGPDESGDSGESGEGEGEEADPPHSPEG